MNIGGTFRFQVSKGDQVRVEMIAGHNLIKITHRQLPDGPILEFFLPAEELADQLFTEGAKLARGGGRIIPATSVPAIRRAN